MPQAHLRETIEQLRRELDAGGSPSSDQLQSLREALGEIDSLLEADASDADHASLGKRLTDAEITFEGSHPKLAAAVRAVVNALSRLGI